MNRKKYLRLSLAFTSLAFVFATQAQEASPPPNVEDLLKERAVGFVQEQLPSFIELVYLDADEAGERSFAIEYDWTSNRDWEDHIEQAPSGEGINFGGSHYHAFAKGNYVFQDDVRPAQLSEIGGAWSRRWFPVSYNLLNATQSQEVQKCVAEAADVTVGPDECRALLGYDLTNLSYRYFDFSVQGKIEGDQSFDQRQYAYGLKASYSQNLGRQKFIVNPVISLALEQVDPVENDRRQMVLADDDVYDRIAAELRFTGRVATINRQHIKLNVSLRYFMEIDPERAIEDAGLDTFFYKVFAFQIPAATFPGLDNQRSSFTLSYTDGELPFNLQSEQTFELGWRHDFDIGDLF